jgi:hypothetical protein
MSAPFQHRYDPAANGRAIQSLSDRSGAAPAEVRDLFVPEFSRLKMGAKVGAYLTVLTESNVRGMLRRKADRLAVKRTPTLARVR